MLSEGQPSYATTTVLYFALFATLQSHFMKGFLHRPTSGSLPMLHETWSLIAISRGRNDPAPVSGLRMCELSSVQICNFVSYSLYLQDIRFAFLSILLSLFIDALQLCCRASLARLSSVHRCLSGCTVAKRCKIWPRLLLITNKKSHIGFQITYKSLTLDNLWYANCG